MPDVKARTAVLVAITSIGLGIFWARTEGPLRDPRDALAEFYNERNRAEDQLIDPLILAGSDVVPLVIDAVVDSNMPRRRYAIGFLGIAGRPEAVPILTRIIDDESELTHIRADAMEALYRINAAVAEIHASRYSRRDDTLGQVAKEISLGSYSPEYDRTWWDALRSAHH